MPDPYDHEPGITVKTPWVTIEGTGLVAIMLFFTALIIGFTVYVQYMNQLEHRAIVSSLNDLFIANMTPAEVKSNLPQGMKDRLDQKVKEKTRQKLEAEP